MKDARLFLGPRPSFMAVAYQFGWRVDVQTWSEMAGGAHLRLKQVRADGTLDNSEDDFGWHIPFCGLGRKGGAALR